MPVANSEIVAQIVAAWNRHDVEAILELTAADALYVNAPVAIEPGTRHGHAEIAEVFRKQWEGLTEDAQIEVNELHEVEGGLVSIGRITLRLGGGSHETSNQIALRWEFDQGKVTHLEVLGGGSELGSALAASGLNLDR